MNYIYVNTIKYMYLEVRFTCSSIAFTIFPEFNKNNLRSTISKAKYEVRNVIFAPFVEHVIVYTFGDLEKSDNTEPAFEPSLKGL